MPKACPGVPDELLNPKKSWTGTADFKEEVTKLGGLFIENFKKYSDQATPDVVKAGQEPLVTICAAVQANAIQPGPEAGGHSTEKN